MAKQKAVYAPGELSKTRERLGEVSKDEAKRMTELLGGEVGYERSDDEEEARLVRVGKRVRNETVEVNIGQRRREKSGGEETRREKKQKKELVKRGNVADDPSISLKSNYWQRIKIDKYCGQMEFEIKNTAQMLVSILSILGDPVDYINPAFVMRRMNNYYKRIELLVTSVRSLLPRNNQKRNEEFKKMSPFAFAIMDTLRYWNIEKISAELTRIQARPRSVKVIDFIEIIRCIYRPLYVLDKLEIDTHIKEAFKTLYKFLSLSAADTPSKEKNQKLIRAAMASYGMIYQDIRFQLYPLLMKMTSHCWVPYEVFFQERRNRIKAFLQVSEANRINPQMDGAMTEDEAANFSGEKPDEIEAEEDAIKREADLKAAEEEQKKREVYEDQMRIVDRSLAVLENLFPKAGWDHIRTYPDMLPYFSDMFKVKKGIALIAPEDPLHQVYFLTRILEELFFGLRYVSFGSIIGQDGKHERLDEPMSRIINEWQKILEASFDKEYISRLTEYCSMLENTAESRTSNYAKRIINELHWAKKLYFFPFYRFVSIMPTPFQKNTLTALFPIVRALRRNLTLVAESIEQAMRLGGPDKRPPCDGIDNPWDSYTFQVPNPVSRRLDVILIPKRRTNASLVYIAWSLAIVLDHLMNEENSWAYSAKTEFPFRSEGGEGVRPLFGIDLKIDTDTTFKQAQKKRHLEAAQGIAAAGVDNETWNIFL
jgi:hypothetical protein